MRDLRSIKMERGITDSKLPPRYNPDFVFPDKLSPYHQVLNFTGSEMMVGGAAGTAKTHHCVLKAHKLACMYPGSTGCVCSQGQGVYQADDRSDLLRRAWLQSDDESGLCKRVWQHTTDRIPLPERQSYFPCWVERSEAT